MEEEIKIQKNTKQTKNLTNNLNLEDIFQEYISKKQSLIQNFYKEIE